MTAPGPARGGLLEHAIVALALAAWFLDHAWRGLLCTFQGDDVMNLYQAWVLPVGRLALGNFTPFSSVYRPVGSAFYKFMYWAAGLHALPYRIAIYALLLLNIALLYRFARLLTGSAETAALAALFGSYHNHLIDLYQNGGAVYDVLCYTFFFAAINCYIAGGAALRGWRLARFLVFALLALNSKEMALTLAAALWLYELVYRAPVHWHPGDLLHWARSDKLALWILTLATPLAAIGKTARGSAFYGVGNYQLHLSWARWIGNTRDWIEGLLFLPYGSLTATGAVLVLLLPLAMAAVVRGPRRKPILLCAALVWLLPLPVNFIDPRNFFVMYIPLAAWSVIAAQALVYTGDWLLQRWAAARVPQVWARAALIAVTVPALHAAQHHDRFRRFEWIDPEQPEIRAFATGLAEHCASLPPSGNVEVLDDPFDRAGWTPVFVARLRIGREDVNIHRSPAGSGNAPAEHYDCTLAYRGGVYAGVP